MGASVSERYRLSDAMAPQLHFVIKEITIEDNVSVELSCVPSRDLFARRLRASAFRTPSRSTLGRMLEYGYVKECEACNKFTKNHTVNCRLRFQRALQEFDTPMASHYFVAPVKGSDGCLTALDGSGSKCTFMPTTDAEYPGAQFTLYAFVDDSLQNTVENQDTNIRSSAASCAASAPPQYKTFVPVSDMLCYRASISQASNADHDDDKKPKLSQVADEGSVAGTPRCEVCMTIEYRTLEVCKLPNGCGRYVHPYGCAEIVDRAWRCNLCIDSPRQSQDNQQTASSASQVPQRSGGYTDKKDVRDYCKDVVDLQRRLAAVMPTKPPPSACLQRRSRKRAGQTQRQIVCRIMMKDTSPSEDAMSSQPSSRDFVSPIQDEGLSDDLPYLKQWTIGIERELEWMMRYPDSVWWNDLIGYMHKDPSLFKLKIFVKISSCEDDDHSATLQEGGLIINLDNIKGDHATMKIFRQSYLTIAQRKRQAELGSVQEEPMTSEITFEYLVSRNQCADIFTKALGPELGNSRKYEYTYDLDDDGMEIQLPRRYKDAREASTAAPPESDDFNESNCGTQHINAVPLPGHGKVLEICTSATSAMGKAAYEVPGASVQRVTNQVDLATRRAYVDLRKLILREPGISLHGSWRKMCYIALARSGSRNVVNSRRTANDMLLNFLDLADIAIRLGGHVSLEWPTLCTGWLLDRMEIFIHKHQCYMVYVDDCRECPHPSNSVPIYQRLRFVTTNHRQALCLAVFKCTQPEVYAEHPVVETLESYSVDLCKCMLASLLNSYVEGEGSTASEQLVGLACHSENSESPTYVDFKGRICYRGDEQQDVTPSQAASSSRDGNITYYPAQAAAEQWTCYECGAKTTTPLWTDRRIPSYIMHARPMCRKRCLDQYCQAQAGLLPMDAHNTIVVSRATIRDSDTLSVQPEATREVMMVLGGTPVVDQPGSFWFEKEKHVLTVYYDDITMCGPVTKQQDLWMKLRDKLHPIVLDEPTKIDCFLEQLQHSGESISQ